MAGQDVHEACLRLGATGSEVPGWFFEDDEIFLPRSSQTACSLATIMHDVAAGEGRPLTVAYWQKVQANLLHGELPALKMYADHHLLRTTDER